MIEKERKCILDDDESKERKIEIREEKRGE